jgi:signal transduction histidine kinase
MGPRANKGRIVWFTLAGTAIGLLLVHPVATLAYTLGHSHPATPLSLPLVLYELRRAFGPDLVHIGVAFAILGGAAGWAMGSWFLQKERLEAEKMECLRDLTALETLKELMVTLAHYIRNANMVVGGFSTHLLKCVPDPECQEQLHLIQQAAQEIDAVIASLQNLTEINTVEYTTSTHELMIDLKRDIEARLAKAQQVGGAKPEGGGSL